MANTGGSIEIYGQCITSHKAKLGALRVLIVVAVASVVLAIGGQLWAEEDREEYINSTQYLNSTTVLQMLEERLGFSKTQALPPYRFLRQLVDE
jgi:hypothetical protein